LIKLRTSTYIHNVRTIVIQ